MFNTLKIKRENLRIRNFNEQSKRKPNCSSCKYIRLYDIAMGYECYKCKLYDPNFNTIKIHEYKCENYSPDREYKKYLERVEHEKSQGTLC